MDSIVNHALAAHSVDQTIGQAVSCRNSNGLSSGILLVLDLTSLCKSLRKDILIPTTVNVLCCLSDLND